MMEIATTAAVAMPIDNFDFAIIFLSYQILNDSRDDITSAEKRTLFILSAVEKTSQVH